MTAVWYIGRKNERTLKPGDWSGTAGGPYTQESSWNADNGWSIPESEFSSQQLAVLELDPEFLTGADDGPRVFPAPGSLPITNPPYLASAHAYYAAIKILYDNWMAGTPGEVTYPLDWAMVDHPATFPPSAHSHAISAVTGLQSAIDDLTALAGSKPSMGAVNTAIANAVATILGGVSEDGDTLAELKSAIDELTSGGGLVPITLPHLLGWTGSAWPARPGDGRPVIWIGGTAPTDFPAQWVINDFWQPTYGDNIDLGPTVEALQAISAVANTIPFFDATNHAATLGFKLGLAENSDSNLVSQKGIKAAIDALNTALSTMSFSPQTGSYTLALSDWNKTIIVNTASANALTIPLNATIALPVGFACNVFVKGSGITTVTKENVSQTFLSNGDKFKSNGQNTIFSLLQTAANEWFIFGSLAA